MTRAELVLKYVILSVATAAVIAMVVCYVVFLVLGGLPSL
jgi:hypothetical protein